MQVADFAERILFADSLEGKLWQPDGGVATLVDDERGDGRAWTAPSRPPELQIAPKRTRRRLPHPSSLADPENRVRVLHTFANHELMAFELMAWALLAFPDTPVAFRRGLTHILADEQRHLQLYIDRIVAHGARFGDLPVNDHFWRCAEALTTPLKWVCAMNLVFEQANLDFAPMYRRHFAEVEDQETAELMDVIERDEILHVGFGAAFLRDNTPAGRSTFDVWVENLTFHNTPSRARGVEFNDDARRRAGLDDDFVARVESATRG